MLDNPDAPTLLATADSYGFAVGHPISYFKGAYGMVLLREQILGPERFDWAFRKYIRDWAYKHPSPSDFFREMQSEGGEDLGWPACAADDYRSDFSGRDQGARETPRGDMAAEGHLHLDAGE